MEFLSKSIKETEKIALYFAKHFAKAKQGRKAVIVGLYGELGSGKTTFMKYLAKALGVKDTIQSPTFVIMKKYQLRNKNNKMRKSELKPHTPNLNSLIHIDAYRLDNGEDLKILGWEEIVSDPKNLICIEWPEKISEIMPNHIKIFFEHVSENERKIKIEL